MNTNDMSNTDYDISKGILNKIRITEGVKKKLRAKNILKEEAEKKDNDAIAITNDAKFGQNVLQNQIDSFKGTVNGGAKFSKENNDNVEENPLIYYPKSGNLVFSGSIPSMGDMKFQFSMNDVTNAPYIFVDGLALTDDVIDTLNKMNGFFKNWKDEWLASGDLLDKLGKEED